MRVVLLYITCSQGGGETADCPVSSPDAFRLASRLSSCRERCVAGTPGDLSRVLAINTVFCVCVLASLSQLIIDFARFASPTRNGSRLRMFLMHSLHLQYIFFSCFSLLFSIIVCFVRFAPDWIRRSEDHGRVQI